MFKFKKTLKLPSAITKTECVLFHEPSKDDMRDNKVNTVMYKFDNSGDGAAIDENFNGFNNSLVQQAVVAIFEYYHPTVRVESLQAMLILDKDTNKLCPVIAFTFSVNTSRMEDMIRKISAPCLYVQKDKFQPLPGNMKNIVGSIVRIACDHDKEMADIVQATQILGGGEDIFNAFASRVQDLGMDILETETYMSRDGIIAHVVHIANFIQNLKDIAETDDIDDSDIDEFMSAVITDICNGSICQVNCMNAFLIPQVHVIRRRDDTVVIVDFTEEINMLIRDPAEDSDKSADTDTSAHIRIDHIHAHGHHRVMLAQTDNVRKISAPVLQELIGEVLNFKGMMYSDYAEYKIVSTRPGKYMPFHGNAAFGRKGIVGTPIHSIYDGTLPKKELTELAVTPCFGTLYHVKCILELKKTAEYSIYDVMYDTKYIAPSDKIKECFKGNDVYTLQYTMAHLCVLRSKKSSMFVLSLPHNVLDDIHDDDYILTHCMSLKGVAKGSMCKYITTGESLIYYIKGE